MIPLESLAFGETNKNKKLNNKTYINIYIINISKNNITQYESGSINSVGFHRNKK